MFCPVCDNVRMKEIEKNHVLIDICPNCKGIWLDRGELEKMIQGMQEDQKYFERHSKAYGDDDPDYVFRHGDDDWKHKGDAYYGKYGKHGHPKKKKKNFMFEIFEDLI